MFTRTACFPLLLLAFAATALFAKEPAKTNARAAILAAPMPDYPYGARSKYLQGEGKFLIHFDSKTGHTTEVETVRSTGYSILDDAAISGKVAPAFLTVPESWLVHHR